MTPDSYSCEIIDIYGCPTVFSDTVVITEPYELVIDSISQDSISCFNYNDGSLQIFVVGGTQPYSYLWDNNDNTIISDTLNSGNYSCFVVDNNGCQVIDSQNVLEPLDITSPTLSLYVDTICYNTSTQQFNILTFASGGGGGAPFTYNWMYQNPVSGIISNVSTGPSYQHNNLTQSSKIWVETYSSYGCGPKSSDTIFIHVYDELLSGSLMVDDSICYNTNIGQIIFNNPPSGANNNYSYLWEFSSDNGGSWNTAQNNNSLNTYNQSYNLIQSILYRVNVMSTQGCGTVQTSPFDLLVFDNFIPGTISYDHEICSGDSADDIYLSVASTGGSPNSIDSYQWQYNNGLWEDVIGEVTSLFNPGSILQNSEYRLKIENICFSNSLYTNSVNIVVNPLPPSVSIFGKSNVCMNSNDVSYTFSNIDSTYSNISYLWSVSNSNQNNFVGPNSAYNCLVNWESNSGYEFLVLKQRDINTGCVFRDTLNILINNSSSPDKCIIQQSPNTEMLISDDVSLGINYQWGYYNISNSNDSFVVYSDTLQFIHYLQEHNQVIDENINRYWVDTWYKNTCKTRSYFNWNPFPLSIDDEIEVFDLTIYPNPVIDKLYYDYDIFDIDIEVIDIIGKKVNCKINQFDKSIDFNNIKSGIYFLIIKDGQKQITKKFIVKS